MEGYSVKVLQFALKELGYYADSIDASFGNNTVNAVKAFQKQVGIRQTGKADKATWEKILRGG